MAKKNHNPYQCVLCSTAEAAEYINQSMSWLEHDRLLDEPKVKFVRQSRCIKYKKADLDAYINSLTENGAEKL